MLSVLYAAPLSRAMHHQIDEGDLNLHKTLFTSAALAVALIPVTPARADSFTTVDLSTYVNSNIAINPTTIPIGTTTGNEATGIPIDIGQYPSASGVEGTWNPDFATGNSFGGPIVGTTLTVNLTSYDISGQASFYALLNNYFGTPGADEYNITITATNGDTATYESIGGVDTRDYNANIFTNTIADTTTPWFNNGIGQRLDIREFSLPAAFAADTIASFTITQEYQGANGDAALFSGLTFSSQPPVTFGVPEPATLGLMAVALAGFGLTRRRAKFDRRRSVGGATMC